MILWTSVSFIFQMKLFSSAESAILPKRMACLILSAIATRSEKHCAELPTRYSKYGALKVLANKLITSFSNKGGLTRVVALHYIWVYSFMDSLSFSIACKIDLSGPISTLNLYYLMKASTKSFHIFTLVLSNRIH